VVIGPVPQIAPKKHGGSNSGKVEGVAAQDRFFIGAFARV
jgi:hypothetical protein